METATQAVTTAATVVAENFHITQVEATLALATLIIALFPACFFGPSMTAPVDFYHGHLSRRRSWGLTQPPRAPMLMAWAFLASLFLMLSGAWYFYNDVATASTDYTVAQYYVAILSLFVTTLAMIFLWKGILWNLHDRTWAMIIAMIFACLVPLMEFIMIILMGIRNVWFSMVFMILLFILHVPLPFWTWVIYSYFKKPKKSHTRARSRSD
jgi:hypothetical protein